MGAKRTALGDGGVEGAMLQYTLSGRTSTMTGRSECLLEDDMVSGDVDLLLTKGIAGSEKDELGDWRPRQWVLCSYSSSVGQARRRSARQSCNEAASNGCREVDRWDRAQGQRYYNDTPHPGMRARAAFRQRVLAARAGDVSAWEWIPQGICASAEWQRIIAGGRQRRQRRDAGRDWAKR